MPNIKIDTTSFSNAMSEVKLRDIELRGLKKKNKNLEEMASKIEEEKKKLAERCQELIDQNLKLNKQVIRQMALQGSKHMIQDEIIKEASKFRFYLDYVANQEDSLTTAKKNVVLEKQELHKKTIQVAQNVVNFFSTLCEDRIKRMGIEDKVVVVSWARRVIGKYRMMETMQAKIDIINHRVEEVISFFISLVNKGIPFFWEEK